VFLELTIGPRFLPLSRNGYLGLIMSHAQTKPESDRFLACGDFGLTAHAPLFHWLEVGGGARVLYSAWDAEPWTPTELEALGVELTGQVRFDLWLMDHGATHVPGSGGMDGGFFVELGLGLQVPVVRLHDEEDADAIFLLRPMAGMIFRFGPDLHWMLGVGYAAAFAHDGWDGNPGPSLQGPFAITGLGVNLR